MAMRIKQSRNNQRDKEQSRTRNTLKHLICFQAGQFFTKKIKLTNNIKLFLTVIKTFLFALSYNY